MLRMHLVSLALLVSVVGVALAACPIQDVSPVVLSLASTSTGEINVYGSHSSVFTLCVTSPLSFGTGTSLQSVTIYGSGKVLLKPNTFRGLSKLKITHVEPGQAGCSSTKTIPIYVPRSSSDTSSIADCDTTAVNFQFQPHTSSAPSTVRFYLRAHNTEASDGSLAASTCVSGLFGSNCMGPALLLDAARMGGYDNSVPMTSGCVSTWKSAQLGLEGTGSGFTTCGASSGFTGTGEAGTPYVVAFDGLDDAVAVAPSSALSGPKVTAEVWFRPTDVTAERVIVARMSQASSNFIGWRLKVSSGVLQAAFGNNGAESVVTGPTLTANNWVHAVLSHDGSQGSLFVNGASVGSPISMTATVNNPSTPPTLAIGHHLDGTTSTSFFKGEIAWVSVQGNLPATASAALALCNANKARFGVTCT